MLPRSYTIIEGGLNRIMLINRFSEQVVLKSRTVLSIFYKTVIKLSQEAYSKEPIGFQ